MLLLSSLSLLIRTLSRAKSIAFLFTLLIRLSVFFVSGNKSLSAFLSAMSGIKMSCVAVKLALCLLAIASLSDAELPRLCGQQKAAGGLVFDGQPSQPGQFPWAGVMLWKDTMKPFCGCSLISNEFAITAAHCFYEKNVDAITSMSSVQVQFGRNDLSDDDEKGFVTRTLIDMTLHEEWDPKYEESYDADIAIIRFNQTVRFSTRIQPICLPNADENIHKNGTVVSIRNARSFCCDVYNFFAAGRLGNF